MIVIDHPHQINNVLIFYEILPFTTFAIYTFVINEEHSTGSTISIRVQLHDLKHKITHRKQT